MFSRSPKGESSKNESLKVFKAGNIVYCINAGGGYAYTLIITLNGKFAHMFSDHYNHEGSEMFDSHKDIYRLVTDIFQEPDFQAGTATEGQDE